ncbi:class I SAM-dependent methyltransferase [bacterium]|nr:MAG: class I SAM-dependent methyltransferase [bacterium]
MPKIMPKKIKTISSFLLCFLLIFQQIGFTQIAAELNIACHLSSLHSSLVSESFRPLHLRYLFFNPLDNNFKLLLDKGDFLKGLSPKRTDPEAKLKEETSKLMQYFLIGLTLPNDTFWVNLRPDSPDQIIDDRLAQTDIGKIMLETDLQLKKDTALFTSPQTPEGREYWVKLYKKVQELYGTDTVTIPTLTRPWIVPGEIIIRETTDSAYIYKATLKVMLEQDYLKTTPNALTSSTDYTFKDQRSKVLNEYSAQLIKELIIPKLTKEVNSSKRYASLRQVYYSLILAQWFKQRQKGKLSISPAGDTFQQSSQESTGRKVSLGFIELIDSRDLTNLTSKEDWSKTTYFKEYQKSFKDGEYNVQEPVYTPTGQVIRSYFSGGEVLTGVSSAMVVIPASSRSPVLANSSLMAIDYPSVSSSPIKGATPPVAGSQAVTELPKNIIEIFSKIREDSEQFIVRLNQQIMKNGKVNSYGIYPTVFYEGDPLTDDEHITLFNFLWAHNGLNIPFPEALRDKIVQNRHRLGRGIMEYIVSAIIRPVDFFELRHQLTLTSGEEKFLWKIIALAYPHATERSFEEDYGQNLRKTILKLINQKMQQSGIRVKILEIGCGHKGKVTGYLKEKFGKKIDAIGIDLNIQPEVNNKAIFAKGDLRKIPFRSGSFGLVYEKQVAQYFKGEELVNILREIMRVLRDGGEFILESLSLDPYKVVAALNQTGTNYEITRENSLCPIVIRKISDGDIPHHKIYPIDNFLNARLRWTPIKVGSSPLKEVPPPAAGSATVPKPIKTNFPLIPEAIDVDNIPAVKNGLLSPEQAAYFIAYKQRINPTSQNMKGINGAAGPSLVDTLLTFDATEVINVNIHDVVKSKLDDALKEWGEIDRDEIMQYWAGNDKEVFWIMHLALEWRRKAHYWNIEHISAFFERLIILELKLLGVPKEEIKIEGSDNNIVIRFPWAFPGQAPKDRMFKFIWADLGEPLQYPSELQNILLSEKETIDFYYQKSAMELLDAADQYLPLMSKAVKKAILISPIIHEEEDEEKLDLEGFINAARGISFRREESINNIYNFVFRYEQDSLYEWYLDFWVKNGNEKASPAKAYPAAAGSAVEQDKNSSIRITTTEENPDSFYPEFSPELTQRISSKLKEIPTISLDAEGKQLSVKIENLKFDENLMRIVVYPADGFPELKWSSRTGTAMPPVGSLGQVTYWIEVISGVPHLLIRDIQSSPEFRRIKPSAERRNLFGKWKASVIEHIVLIAESCGIREVYAPTYKMIRLRGPISQGNAREDYIDPFRNNIQWEKKEAFTPHCLSYFYSPHIVQEVWAYKGESSASPLGGIDFRFLPIVTQAMTNLSANLRGSFLGSQFLQRVNLDVEWNQIEQLSSSGIRPSPERIREYAQASSALGRISQDKDKIILCIADILRQEEEQNCETEPILRDILVVLESVQQPQELKRIFLGKV